MRDKIFYQLWVLEVVKKASFRKVLTGVNLYCGQDQILRFIRKNPGCKQIDIAKFYQCTPASIATSTKRLEKNGFLEKRSSEESLREKSLFITDKGLDALNHIHDEIYELDNQALGGISDSEKEELTRLLDKLIFNFAGKDINEIDIQDYLKQLQEDKGHGKTKKQSC